MEKREFHLFRLEFQKTQKEMAELLGTSVKAVQSFEQGWRKVPAHVERQLLFLHVMKRRKTKKVRSCWEIRRCSPILRQTCPAFEFHSGHLCWFINGTLCKGRAQGTWAKKMKICRGCQVFGAAVGPCDKGKTLRSKGNGKGNGNGRIVSSGR
jgi:hypothetical protein